jgi:hypothetical protein
MSRLQMWAQLDIKADLVLIRIYPGITTPLPVQLHNTTGRDKRKEDNYILIFNI